jgi:hypothetical protein
LQATMPQWPSALHDVVLSRISPRSREACSFNSAFNAAILWCNSRTTLSAGVGALEDWRMLAD